MNTLGAPQIRADAIVRSQLGKSSRTARPLLLVVNLLRLRVVVRIVKTDSIRPNRSRSENRVVKHRLHAVAISALPRHAHQVTSDLEVPISPTGSLEAVVRLRQAIGKLIRL